MSQISAATMTAAAVHQTGSKEDVTVLGTSICDLYGSNNSPAPITISQGHATALALQYDMTLTIPC